jgi:hypothetical protein
VLNRGRAPATPLERPLETRGEAPGGPPGQAPPVEVEGLLERVLERTTLLAAWILRSALIGGIPRR